MGDIMTNEQKERLIQELRTHHHWSDKDNCWHTKIYSDYADQQAFIEYHLPKVLMSDTPIDTYHEIIFEAYQESEQYEKDWVFKQLLNTEIGNEIDGDELREFIDEHAWIDYPDFLDLEFPVNVVIDGGDANYDFGINSCYEYHTVDSLSGITYLAEKQGYTLSEIRKAIKDKGHESSKFLKSVVTEWINTKSGCNAVTIFATITMSDWLYFQELKKWEEPINNRYYPWKGKGRSYISISKESDWGLVNYWHGAGSVLSGVLEKSMNIPIRYVWDIIPEVRKCKPYGYTVQEIYGCSTDWYDGQITVHKVNNKLLKEIKK
jgi:hypothetical protein